MSNNITTTRSSPSDSTISKPKNHHQDESAKKASDFPYETNYNDHFETPVRAFQDVALLLDWMMMMMQTKKSNNNYNNNTSLRQIVTLYDPYYCNGRSKRILQDQLGYRHVVHEKRDFYNDIQQQAVPRHDVFITNPPYSDQHKTKCLEFCLGQWNESKCQIPFLILMPAYVATRKYYRDLMLLPENNDSDLSIVYLLPSCNNGPYEYDHPEGTGKEEAPFDSVWFCSVPKHQIPALQDYWSKQQQLLKDQSQTALASAFPGQTNTTRTMPRIAFSVQELADMKVVASLDERRPNPRQRKKRRRMQQQLEAAAGAAESINQSSRSNDNDNDEHDDSSLPLEAHAHHGGKHTSSKNSKYRGNDGQRTKKRF